MKSEATVKGFSLARRGLWIYGFVSVLAVLAVGLESLSAQHAVWPAHIYGQWLSLMTLLPFFGLLLPGICGWTGLPRRDSRLQGLCLTLQHAGCLFLLLAGLQRGLEAGWMFAMAHPLTRDLVSVWQWLGLLSLSLCTVLLSLQRGLQHRDPLMRLTAIPVVAGMTLVASSAFFGLMLHWVGMELVDPLGFLTGPAWPVAAGLSLLLQGGLLTFFAAAVGPVTGTVLQRRLLLGGGCVAVLAFFAPELRLLPQDLPVLMLLSGTLANSLLAAAWASLLTVALVRVPQRDAVLLACIGLVVFLTFWLNLVTASAVFSAGHQEAARRFVFAFASVWLLLRQRRAISLRWRQVLLLPAGATFLMLMLLGRSGIPAGLAKYPLALQTGHWLTMLGLTGLLAGLSFRLLRFPADNSVEV